MGRTRVIRQEDREALYDRPEHGKRGPAGRIDKPKTGTFRKNLRGGMRLTLTDEHDRPPVTPADLTRRLQQSAPRATASLSFLRKGARL